MKKMIFAAAAMLLYAPLAQAATVFDLSFTGTFASLGSPTAVSGTGTVTVAGLTGTGFENAPTGGLSPKITDLDISLNNYHFGFAGTLADLVTFNGDPVGFSFTGVDTLHSVPFVLSTVGFSPDFGAVAGTGIGADIFLGTLAMSAESIGTVPEPATWAMLVLGFGGIGAMLRLARRRQDVAAAVA